MERVAFDRLLTATVPSIEEAARKYATLYGIFPAWKDIAQSAFLKMLRFADQYDPAKGALLPWACVIIVNTIKTYITRLTKFPHMEDIDTTATIELPALSDSSPEMGLQIGFILSHINTETRLHVEGFNYQEIAARRGMKSKSTVFSRIENCTKRLSAILGIKYNRCKRSPIRRKKRDKKSINR